MIALEKLTSIQAKNKSLICLGLDLDPQKVPDGYGKSTKGLYDFAARIIDATSDLVCAYKPNIAFYENLGPEGMSLLKLLIDRIPDDIPIIIDAKRGDIGNTAAQYAEALYDKLGADWVTLNPYMGYDSIRPFLEYKNKGVFILCLTSNSGAKDFQLLNVDGKPLYQVVAEKVAYWDKEEQCGLVVGATQPEQLKEIRRIAGKLPILIPGVGAQGGSLELAVKYGTDNFSRPAVINVSRSILYASSQDDFAARARGELRKLNSSVDAIRQGDSTTPEETADSDTTQIQIQRDQNKETNKIIIQAPPAPETDNREQDTSPPQQDETGLPSEGLPPGQPAEQETTDPDQTAPIPTNITTPSDDITEQDVGASQPENQTDNSPVQSDQKEPEQKREFRGDRRSRRRFDRHNRHRNQSNPDHRSSEQGNDPSNSPGPPQNNNEN